MTGSRKIALRFVGVGGTLFVRTKPRIRPSRLGRRLSSSHHRGDQHRRGCAT
jgi:hypothetical protein